MIKGNTNSKETQTHFGALYLPPSTLHLPLSTYLSPMPFPAPIGVVLLGHGSQEPATADEMKSLRDALGAQLADHRFTHAFLNQEPRLEAAIERLVGAGCPVVRVLPLLVFTGRHMMHDVPAEIERLRALHPGTTLEIEPHLFRLPGFSALLARTLGTIPA